MSCIDIKLQVRYYLRSILGQNKDWRDEDIILDRLTLKPRNVNWSCEPAVTKEGINSTIKVQKNANNQNSAQASPQIHTVKDSDVIGNVTLKEGVMKGLNKMLTIPLKGTEFSNLLGNDIRINVGKQVTELKKDKMTIAVSVEVGGQSASATVRTIQKIYKGSFECDVTLSGIVIIDDQDGGIHQQQISAILNPNPIRVQGDIEFLWDQQQNVNMAA